MIKDRFLILVIIFLFILNLFTLGYLFYEKQPPPPPFEDGTERVFPPGEERGPRDMDPNRKDHGRPDEMIINKLKLNKEQILKFEELKSEHHRLVEDIQFASKKLHDEYFGILQSETPDTVKASQLLTEIGKNQQLLDKITFEHFAKIKGICGNDQKLLFNSFIDEIAGSFKPPIQKK